MTVPYPDRCALDAARAAATVRWADVPPFPPPRANCACGSQWYPEPCYGGRCVECWARERCEHSRRDV